MKNQPKIPAIVRSGKKLNYQEATSTGNCRIHHPKSPQVTLGTHALLLILLPWLLCLGWSQEQQLSN